MVYEFCIYIQRSAFRDQELQQWHASEANLEDIRKMMTIQTIGHDKVNQLRHVRYFKNIRRHQSNMMKTACRHLTSEI